MDALDPVALYGAILATITAGWEIAKSIRARKPKLRVEGRLTMAIRDESTMRDTHKSILKDSPMPALDWRADIIVVNVGSSQLQIMEVELQQSHQRGTRSFKSTNWVLPHVLAPGERVDFACLGDAVDGLEIGAPVKALVRTGKGVQFESDDFGHGPGTHVSVRRGVLEKALGRDLNDMPGLNMHEITVDGVGDEDWDTGLALPAVERKDKGLN